MTSKVTGEAVHPTPTEYQEFLVYSDEWRGKSEVKAAGKIDEKDEGTKETRGATAHVGL